VRTDQNADPIERQYQEAVKYIKDSLMWLPQSANQFNDQLKALVTSHLEGRKKRLLADAGDGGSHRPADEKT
jgi:hypothetical protein